MWIRIEHELTFRYDDFVNESRMELRVEPRTTYRQTLRTFSLAIGPPTRVRRYTDWNGNLVHHFGIGNYHDRIEVLATSLVETHPSPLDLSLVRETPLERSLLGSLREMTGFEGPIVRSPTLETLAAELDIAADAPLGEQVLATGRLIKDRFEYRSGVTDFQSTTDHLIEAGAGVCQDFAHLQAALLRLRGIPTRYVSGYLHLGTGEEAQSHAWIEAYSVELGWLPFDPTHDRVPDEQYVLVGWGRNYDDVPPNRGIYRGSASEHLDASVRTSESEPQDIVDLREAIDQIEVPVFRELPSRRPNVETEQPEQQERQQQQ